MRNNVHPVWLLACVLVAGLLTSASSDASQIIREFRGTGDETTATFIVESPWIIDWRLDGDYDSLIALDVQLLDAETGRMVGRVLHTKYKGNGVRLFRQSGSYQLRVSSTLARWTLKVEQLSEEEAKRYTPRKPIG